MSLRRILHAVLGHFGYEMHKITSYAYGMRKYEECEKLMRKQEQEANFHADQMREHDRPLPLLELALESALRQKPEFFFVQVGANNGKSWDPLHQLICRYRLRGLLIEPLPDFFQELRATYASQPQLIFENAAIAPKDGEATIYRVRPGAPVEDWVHGCATLNRERMVSLLRGYRVQQHLDEAKVPALTMGTLLAKHQIFTVDLLQIDVEGYDLEVIKMTFEAGCFPGIIHFENEHLTDEGRREARLVLAQNNYRFTDGSHDTLAIRSPAKPLDALAGAQHPPAILEMNESA